MTQREEMQTKTLHARELELQHLMATREGRRELEEIAERYHDAGGRARHVKASVITYILVHERQQGLIVG
jgi:hypothetical protein